MILATCVVSCFAIAQAQPLTNVNQQKQPVVTAKTPDATAKPSANNGNKQIAEMFAQERMHCPAGVHYFVGYNPCIPPSPWDPPADK